MKVIDLFAGVGGWSEGARQAGHEVIAAVEYDQTAADYYARNHGPHVIWPEGKSAATRLIGNAVPPKMAQALLKDLT